MFQVFKHVSSIQACFRYSSMFQVFKHVSSIQALFFNLSLTEAYI